MKTVREIWNDECGDCLEVGPDRDGLDNVEIRYKNGKGEIKERFVFPPEMAILVANAILSCANELKGKGVK